MKTLIIISVLFSWIEIYGETVVHIFNNYNNNQNYNNNTNKNKNMKIEKYSEDKSQKFNIESDFFYKKKFIFLCIVLYYLYFQNISGNSILFQFLRKIIEYAWISVKAIYTFFEKKINYKKKVKNKKLKNDIQSSKKSLFEYSYFLFY